MAIRYPDDLSRKWNRQILRQPLWRVGALLALSGFLFVLVSCGLGERKLQEFRKRTIADANRVVVAIKNESGSWPVEGTHLHSDERWNGDLRLVRYRRVPSGGYQLWIQREDLGVVDSEGFFTSPEREPRDGDIYATFAENGDLVACSWRIPEWDDVAK